MKPRFYGICTLVAALAALAIARPARADELVPFKGTLSGVVTVTGVSYPIVTFTGTAAGEATHLGHFTFIGPGQLNLTTHVLKAVGTYTAANGDQIVTNQLGQFVDATHLVQTDTIVAGAGRFQGATGSFTVHAETFPNPSDPLHIPFTFVFEGAISSPGANK